MLRKKLTKNAAVIVVCFLGMFFSKSTLVSYACSNEVGDLPFFSELCADQNSTQMVIRVKPFMEENLVLAERISMTDVDTTGKLAEARMSLFDLTTLVSFCQLEPSAKHQLMEKIDETADHAQLASRGMHKMLAKFNNALGEMESYAKRLFKHLRNQKSFFSRWTAKAGELVIVEYFKNDLETLENEVARIANDTEKVNSMLGMYFSREEKL